MKPDKTLRPVHDFQVNEMLSKLLALHIAVEALAKMGEPPKPDLHQTLESKADNAPPSYRD